MLLIANAELDGRRGVSVRVEDGVISEIGPDLRAGRHDEVVDARGGALIPGLHDHHVHLRSAAAALESVHLGPPEVVDAPTLARRLATATGAVPPGAWIRGIGYHEAIAGVLDRTALDRLVPDTPVRIQHAGGAMWMLNSLALDQAGIATADRPEVERDEAGRPTGRVWRDGGWLSDRIPGVAGDIAAVSAAAAEKGVTGVTEATPDLTQGAVDELVADKVAARLHQRLHVMCPPEVAPQAAPGVSVGPVKVLLDDDSLPTPAVLAERVAESHRAGRAVAVHAVTRVQLVVAVAAFREAGTVAGDRIEHGSLVPAELLDELAALRVVVVTQPNFVAERGWRYAAEVDAEDLDDLYRCRSLMERGVRFAFGTDAPFGCPDPWAAMRAAVDRRTSCGKVLGPSEAVKPLEALRGFLGRPDRPEIQRRVGIGEPADLCVLRLPLSEALRELSSDVVSSTIVGGICLRRPS